MGFSLDLEHLRTLIAISECGGFGKAAAARHISQPALSQHIRLLERGLKRKLFEREGRVMRLTVDGERVLAEARRIVDVHDEALRRLEVSSPVTIVVGSTEHSAEPLLPEMLRALNGSFPQASPRFEIGRSTQLHESVEKGTVDLAFVLDPSGQGPGHLVGELPLLWYSSEDRSFDPSDEVLRLVAFEEPCSIRERALSVLAAEGIRVEVVAQSTTLEGVLAGVRAGLGIALLPSAGGAPAGLRTCGNLPRAGATHLRLISRRGLPPEITQTALDTAADFFVQRPTLYLVSVSDRGA
ncbi:LysR substrate-binding domain-containing protein [Gordonia sp. NB41Y]|uniref:LysR substrate-binding domain-containing protein n=1 Tax=Gordonia sp. NB41Y TaxID=875808 RepID=UPI0002BD3B3B|nr:LysR substrate-binding domain-containing protein [Gordonia sp. NB41Y]WLP88452.1 LysR substrate-binding domain-containing protein [Gordonia sp. NB41Y]